MHSRKRNHAKVELVAFDVNLLLLTLLWVGWRSFPESADWDHPCFAFQQLGRGLGSVVLLGVLLMADIVLAIAWIGAGSSRKSPA
jgi:hypothetical protein